MVNWQYRAAHGAASDLIALFRRALESCRLQAGERLMIYADHHSPTHYATAFAAAATQLGAAVFTLTIPTHEHEILDGPIWDVWHSVDMVVDLETIGTSIYRPLRVSALQAGVRILRVTQPEEVLFRMPPDLSVRDRVRRAETMLEQARRLHVHSDAGTDLEINIANRAAFGLWGAPDEPGKWDHWSVGVVVGGASRPATNGTLVLDVGDIILAMQRYVTSRVTLTVEEGIITRIDGGLDATLLRQWFAQWNDPRAYYISHIGWGCDPRADWNRMARKELGGLGDAESYPGVFQIAFGRDTSWYIGGGSNDVAAHIDLNCLHQSMALDGEPITRQGVFVHEDLQ